MEAKKEIKGLRGEIHHLEIEGKKDANIVLRIKKNVNKSQTVSAISAHLKELDGLSKVNYELKEKIEESDFKKSNK